MTPAPGTGDVDRVVGELRDRAGELWGLSGPVAVEVSVVAERRRCTLYGVDLSAGGARHRVLVKMRRAVELRSGQASDRPELAPRVEISEEERTVLELEGLRVAEAAVAAAGSPLLAAVRPLLAVPAERAVAMERVTAPTLRHELDRRAAPWARPRRVDDAAWHALGAWLRSFQAVPETVSRGERLTSAAEVAELVERFAGHLARATGRTRLLDRVRRSAGAVEAALPARLPTALAHADFAPRNVFVEPGGRLRVFDPMPVWRAPVGEDLARMVVSLHLGRLRVLGRGLAVPLPDVLAAEQALVAGWTGGAARPRELDAVCLLVALDQWTSLVHLTERLPGPASAAAQRWLAGTVEAGAGRWLDRLHAT